MDHTNKQVLLEGNFLRLVKVGHYEFTERIGSKGVVVIFPKSNQNTVILVEQFRVPLQKMTLELPAGIVENNEEFLDAARRELLEETGYYAESLEEMGCWPTSSGLTSEVVRFYYATGLSKVHSGGGDVSEGIIVHEIPFEGLKGFLDHKTQEGILIDPKIYAGLFLIMC